MSNPTLSQAVQLFLSSHKPTTRESYRWPLNRVIAFIGPDRPISTITESHIAEFMADLGERTQVAATYNKYAKTTRTLFNWLVKNDFLTTSPARIFKPRRQLATVQRAKAMHDGDLAQLLAYTHFRPRDHALIMFLADTGARAGGAAGLRLQDLNLAQREATVTEKGDKSRTVAYGHATAQALQQWLRLRPRTSGIYVFSRTTHPMLASSISQIVSRACVAAGLPRAWGSHSLRHRKGFQMADARIAPSVAATALGHASPTITLSHYYPNDWDRAKQAIAELALPDARPDSKITPFPRTS